MVKLILQTYILLSGVVGWALVTGAAAHPSPSSTPSTMDAKEARAWAAQLEHTKLIIAYAASDFEKSLHQGNLASCERQLTERAVVSLNGIRMRGCKDLIHSRPSPYGEHRKFNLRRQEVEITDTNPEALVIFDVAPESEHHVLKLMQLDITGW
jgi:hypothetical protein